MSLAVVLSAYINLHVMIGIAVTGLCIFTWILNKIRVDISARLRLRLHYLTLGAVVLTAVLQPFVPKADFFSPTAKVWASRSSEKFSADYSVRGNSGYLQIPRVSEATEMWNARRVGFILQTTAAAILIIAFFILVRGLRTLYRARRRAYLLRRAGRVRVYVSGDIPGPYSYAWFGQAHVVMPLWLVKSPQEFRIAVAHELQHHRQGDTRWLYIMLGLRIVAPLHPLIYFWSSRLSEVQEFACDEALLEQKKVDSHAYARCLIEVAQTAMASSSLPACAPGFVAWQNRHILKRRILKMLNPQRPSTSSLGRRVTLAFGAILAISLAATSYAASNWVQDRRVTLAQAEAFVAKAKADTDLPVFVNDLVLKQLNRILGTPEGREKMRATLARLESYRAAIEPRLKFWNVTNEFLAIPIVESNYRNLTQVESGTRGRAAGLWQFIPETARKFDMRVEYVDGQVEPLVDERTDVEKSTDGAARYLQVNRVLFRGDWWLSALAYNMGERAVQRGIDKLGGVYDAWALVRAGHEGDKDYLPKLMAAILIMKNPDSLR